MENSEEMASLTMKTDDDLVEYLLKASSHGQLDVISRNLKSFDRSLDRELVSISAKHKEAILQEMQTIKFIRKTYDSPNLAIKMNSFDETVSNLTVGFLSEFEKLKSDVDELDHIEEELAAIDKKIKIDQLFSKFNEDETKLDYKLLGQFLK